MINSRTLIINIKYWIKTKIYTTRFTKIELKIIFHIKQEKLGANQMSVLDSSEYKMTKFHVIISNLKQISAKNLRYPFLFPKT